MKGNPTMQMAEADAEANLGALGSKPNGQ